MGIQPTPTPHSPPAINETHAPSYAHLLGAVLVVLEEEDGRAASRLGRGTLRSTSGQFPAGQTLDAY